jgi:hypothetical protein
MKNQTDRSLYSTPEAEIALLRRELKDALDALKRLCDSPDEKARNRAMEILAKHEAR